jgi:FAD/FMN-containing dehydrogenase
MDAKTGARLTSILPRGHVIDNPARTKAALTANPLIDPGVAPTHIVAPRDGGELQELMELSNETGLNLTVASSAGGHTKGGTAAQYENILVDLSSWKAIDRIDRRNRVSLVGPGVTYGELKSALADAGMTIPMPLSPRSTKSVVASVTDREPSTWPNRHWDWGDPVASTEVIFGNGSLFRTGSAGGPGTLAAQRAVGGAQKYSGGPSQTDLHRVVQGSQGTIGIITWVTIRTEIRPTVERPLLVGTDDPGALISFVYEVGRLSLGEHTFILNRRALSLLMGGTDKGSQAAGYESLPLYILLLNIAGFERLPKQRLRYQEHDIRKIARRHGLSPGAGIGGVSAERLLDKSTTPCGELDWRHEPSGHCLSVFFLTTLDLIPGLVEIALGAARRRRLDPDAVGVYIQPVVQNHACHVEFMLPFDPARDGEVERMRGFEREVVGRLAKAGAFFSRPYGAAQQIVFAQNPIQYDLQKKVKDIFDPRRVLNRGKWGL